MNAATLIEAFDRAKEKASEAWSAAEVVQIIQELENLTLDYIGQPADRRIEVGNLTKWG